MPTVLQFVQSPLQEVTLPCLSGAQGYQSRTTTISAEQVLKQVFGYDTFRAGQLEGVTAILNGQDVLILVPTGGGKQLFIVFQHL